MGASPNNQTLTFIGCRVESLWDENTPLGKGPHSPARLATWAHFRRCGECLADDASRSIALVTVAAAAWLSQAVGVERFLSVFLVSPQLPLTQRYDNERIANSNFGSHGDL